MNGGNMRKMAMIMAIIVGTLFVAGCASDNGNKDNGPTVVIDDPGVKVIKDGYDHKKAQLCAEAGDEITNGLTAMSEGITLLPYVSDAEAREFLATAREFVSVSKETVKLCAELAPAEARELLAGLDQLDNALAELEALY